MLLTNLKFLVPLTLGGVAVALAPGVATHPASASRPDNILQPAATQTDKGKAGNDKTDAFGDPLPPGVVARMGSGRLRHAGPVLKLVFTASGKLVSTGYDATVRLWDGKSGKELFRLEAGEAWVQGLAVSRDETLVAAGGDAIYVWDARTGKRLHRLQGAKPLTYAVALSPDGTRLVSGDGDDAFRLWDTASGKLLRTFSADKTFIPQVAFSPDGKMLASSHALTVWLWDPATGKQLRQLRGHESTVHTLAFSPDGGTVATGSYDQTIRLWDVSTGKLLRVLKGHTHQVLSVAFSPDGKQLASAGGDNMVRLWAVASGKEHLQIRQGPWERENVNCVAFSPDGTTLAAGSNQLRIRVWDAVTGKEKQPPRGPDGAVNALVFTPDGKQLISGCSAGTVIGWEVATGQERRTYSRDCHTVHALALSPDGRTLVAGCGLATFAWNSATGEEVFKAPGGPGLRIAFLPQGRLLACDGWRVNKLWNLATGKPVGEVPPGVLAALSDGRILYQKDNSLFLHDPTAPKDEVEIKLPVPKPPPFDELKGKLLFNLVGVNCAAVSPDGKTFATASQAYLTNKVEGFGHYALYYEEALHFWEVSSGKLLSKITLPWVAWGLHGRIECLAFSPDGRTLAGGGRAVGDQRVPAATVLFWDVLSGKEIHQMQIPRLAGENTVACLAFSPDGKTLATGGCDTTVLVWQLPPAIAARATKR